MKRTKLLSVIFGALGLLLAAACVALSLTRLQAQPVLVTIPEDARAHSEALMEAICRGDYDQAGKLLYGTPNLGVDRAAADEVGQMIWKEFVSSLEYEFVGDFYATDTGIARDVSITALDITSVTQTLGSRSQALLEHRVAAAHDVSQIYDENNDYREDFVMNILYDAAYQSLQEDARCESHRVTLNLVYRQGQWWVLPDSALLRVTSGGTAG